MRLFQVVALTGFLMWAGGCVRTIQPILKDEQLIVDPALAGQWVNEDGKSSADVTAPGKDSKDYEVVYTDEKKKPAHFIMRLGKIGNLMVVDVSPDTTVLADQGDIYAVYLLPLHSLMVVTTTPTKLTVQVMQSDWLKKYLDQHPGELAATQGSGNDFIVTASTDDFQKFLLKHWKDEGALDKPGVMVRPGDATTQPATTP